MTGLTTGTPHARRRVSVVSLGVSWGRSRAADRSSGRGLGQADKATARRQGPQPVDQISQCQQAADGERAAAPWSSTTIYNVSGRLTRNPPPETRDDEGRWIGGGVTQWVEEQTFAVREHGAAAFIYLLPPGDSLGVTTLNLWAHEVVPAVRGAITKR